MATTSQSIQEIYIGLLGRAADKAGLDYWTAEIDANTLTLEQLRANIVSDQPEYAADLGSKTRSQTVAELYNRMFERAAEAADLTYWVDGDGASVNVDQLVLALTNGAAASDRLVLDNKTEAAEYYSANTATYTADGAKAAVDSVDGTSASLDASKQATDGGTQNGGTTFTLTTGVDTFTGSTDSDTFVGADSGTDTADTVNVGDSLDGGAGTDTLRITIADNDASPITLSNVENVELIGSAATGTISAQNWTGVEKITLKNAGVDGATTSAAEVANLSSNVVIDLENVKVNTDDDDALTIGYAAGTLGLTGAVTINTNNVGAATRAAELVLDTNGSDVVTSATIAAGGATVLSLNAEADGDVALTSLTVSGAGALTLTETTNAEFNDVATFNASANTGGVTVDLSTSTADIAITGGEGADSFTANLANDITIDAGAGNDVVTLSNATAANLSTATNAVDSIKGGAGTDVLAVTAANADSLDGDTAADRAAISEFETLRITDDLNGTTLDVSKISGGLNNVQIGADTTTADATINGLTSGATIENRASSHSQTITVGGTTEIGDVASATVNGTQYSFTATAGTNANAADGLAGVINAALGAGSVTGNGDGTITANTVFVSAASQTDNNAASQTIALVSDTSDIVVGMTGATGAGTPDDLLNISLNANLTNNDQLESSYQVDGINKLVVTTADRDNTDGTTSRDDGYVLGLDNDSAVSLITASGTNSLSFTSTAETAALATFNAAELTGDLAVNLTTNGLTQGVTVTGGAGTNTITGTGFGDVITGGARADVLTGAAGSDTLTGNAGADAFVFAGTANITGGVPSDTVFDTITDFAAGSDIIRFDATLTVETSASSSVGVAAINAEGIASFNAADDTLAEKVIAVQAGIVAGTESDGDFAIFEHGSDSYVFIEGSAGTLNAADALIKLTGVTGLSDSTISTTDLVIA